MAPPTCVKTVIVILIAQKVADYITIGVLPSSYTLLLDSIETLQLRKISIMASKGGWGILEELCHLKLHERIITVCSPRFDPVYCMLVS